MIYRIRLPDSFLYRSQFFQECGIRILYTYGSFDIDTAGLSLKINKIWKWLCSVSCGLYLFNMYLWKIIDIIPVVIKDHRHHRHPECHGFQSVCHSLSAHLI